MTRSIILALVSLGLLAAAEAMTGEKLPCRYGLQADLNDNDTISIDGTVEGPNPVTVVLRIDDALSKDYAGRTNLERSLPPSIGRLGREGFGARRAVCLI